MSRKHPSAASVRQRARSRRRSFATAYRSFLVRHALDEVGLEEGFAASIRDKSKIPSPGFK